MSSSDLKSFVAEVAGANYLRVEDDLGDGYVRLRSAEAERRQAKHDIRGTEDIVIEMLRNSRDAGASKIFCATSRDGSLRNLTIIDDGCGIPPNLVERVFEARVTSKLDSMHVDTWGVHGRGMALFAVKENAIDAHVAATVRDGGTSIAVTTDTRKLPEKTDQSSFPVFSLSEAGTIVVRGTRNINRTVAEFAYIDRDVCTVFLGTPVEIAATLYDCALGATTLVDRAFTGDFEGVALVRRLALAATPEQFALIAASMGLSLSDRSARRIMDGEIAPLPAVADSIDPYALSTGRKGGKKSSGKAPLDRDQIRNPLDRRGLKVADGDMKQFKKGVKKAYADLAESYFLEKGVEPTVKVKRDCIRITIPVRKQL